MKKIFFWVIAIIILIIVLVFSLNQKKEKNPPSSVNNFEECRNQGYAILEFYPRQCRTPDGKTFVEDIGNEIEKKDLIQIANPRPNTIVKSPLSIEGKARGYWFFEASFPVRLLDGNGKEIGVVPAQALSDWMTEDFVSFKAELQFSTPTTKKGTLILQKDNPSGLPENDDSLMVPVLFY